MKKRFLTAAAVMFALIFAYGAAVYAAVVYDGMDDMKTALNDVCVYPAHEGAVNMKGAGRLAAA